MSNPWSSRRSTTSTGSSSRSGSSSSRRNNSIIQNPPPPPNSTTITPYTLQTTSYAPRPLPPPQNHYQYHSYYYSNSNGYVKQFQYHLYYASNQQQQQLQLDWDPDWDPVRDSDRDPNWDPRRLCPYPPNPSPDPHFDHHQTTRTARNNANVHRLQLLEIDEDNPDHHQTAKMIRNNVNIHKHTLRLEIDQHNPDHHLLSFVFDAVHDGRFTIFYVVKEEKKSRFVPLFPNAFEPFKVPFKKGIGQKFSQPSGTGVDLGFFGLDYLSKPSPGEDVFPLVMCAKTCRHMQATQAVLEKSNSDGAFQIKVVKQIIWIDGVRSELREPYGIGSSTNAGFDDSDPGSGKECIICMTKPKDTVTLPCEHMCMCKKCAKALQLKSNKCPICRQPIEELIKIKVKRWCFF